MESTWFDSVSSMPQSPANSRSADQPRIAFAYWLDAFVLVFYKSDAALARAVGVDRSLVSRWRRGMVPQVPALVRLAEETKTDLSVLMRIAGYKPDGSRSE
jgi:hypothetical protein